MRLIEIYILAAALLVDDPHAAQSGLAEALAETDGTARFLAVRDALISLRTRTTARSRRQVLVMLEAMRRFRPLSRWPLNEVDAALQRCNASYRWILPEGQDARLDALSVRYQQPGWRFVDLSACRQVAAAQQAWQAAAFLQEVASRAGFARAAVLVHWGEWDWPLLETTLAIVADIGDAVYASRSDCIIIGPDGDWVVDRSRHGDIQFGFATRR